MSILTKILEETKLFYFNKKYDWIE